MILYFQNERNMRLVTPDELIITIIQWTEFKYYILLILLLRFVYCGDNMVRQMYIFIYIGAMHIIFIYITCNTNDMERHTFIFLISPALHVVSYYISYFYFKAKSMCNLVNIEILYLLVI